MVTLTDRAAAELQRVVDTTQATPEEAVRLAPDGSGGLAMSLDTPHAEDEVLRRGESAVLLIDQTIAPQLADMVLDCETTVDDPGASPRFRLERQGEQDQDQA
jgi:Fe-S cluster assembly iron-binding protein IscA